MINVKILNFHRAAIRGFFTMQISFKRLTFACLVFLLLLHNATTWGQSDHTKRLIEGAKKEGKLVWYTALSIQMQRCSLNASSSFIPSSKPKL
jgi:hypothetical protein